MNTDFIFETIDRFVSKFSPINILVDLIATRLAPKAEVMAYNCQTQCPGGTYISKHYGPWCYWFCNDYCRRVDVYEEHIWLNVNGNACHCNDGCGYTVLSIYTCAPC